MKEKKLISSTLAVVILTVIFLSLPICFFNADIQYKEKIIFAKGHDILPYSEGIRQFDLSEQTEQFISIELSDVFSESEEYNFLMQNREFVSECDIDEYVMRIRNECKAFYAERRADFVRSVGLDDELIEQSGYSHILEINKEALQAEAMPLKV